MKKLSIILLFSLCVVGLFSQTVNYAINNSGSGSVELSAIHQLNGSAEATVQMWFSPNGAITADMQLFSQDNLQIFFADNQTITVKSGAQEAKIVSTFKAGLWYQLTVTIKNGAVKAYLNNQSQVVAGSLPETFATTTASSSCYLAKNFNGRLDEIRVWKRAIEQKDFFWRNTLNKFNPNYDALISYWKCDQDQCENLVDYKFAHHGVLNNVQRVAVKDNAQFRYRVVSGYTNLMRFIDRPNINRDMFLMTNDLILLSAKVQQDGSLFPEFPDNTATPTNVSYLAEYQGRTGVMSFAGAGSKMVSPDGNAPFDPTDRFGHGEPITASLAMWLYIDKWTENAELFSKYQNETNCMVVKLGAEADKSIVVNFNGSIATLKGKLETGKWQYVGVYFMPSKSDPTDIFFNPVAISVDFKTYDRLDGVLLSGKGLTINRVPLLATTPIVIGKDFNGKMDEIMLWGADRKGSSKNDAQNGYKLNTGNWGNIFLNAYWKGDDPANIGKDSQSFTGMMEFIRNYYAGHRGMKIRMGIIYPDGEKWQGVLNQKVNVDRLIADAKKLLTQCDGLDVDLEWSYYQWQYDIFNNVVRRLINEVMAGNRQTKAFSVSLHEVSYSMDKSLFPDIDFFTFQLYGPQPVTYTWDWYVNAYNKFMNYGFPKDKILLSYGVLLVNQGEQGYKDLFEKYGMNDANYNPNLNQWNCNGVTKSFNGVTQVKRKMDYIIEKDVLGTMYFDMGNDQRVSDYKSLIRAQNDILASNVDTLILKVDLNTSVRFPKADKQGNKLFTCYPNPAKDYIVVKMSDSNTHQTATCEILSLDGKQLLKTDITAQTNSIPLKGIAKGAYLLKVNTERQSQTVKMIVQ